MNGQPIIVDTRRIAQLEREASAARWRAVDAEDKRLIAEGEAIDARGALRRTKRALAVMTVLAAALAVGLVVCLVVIAGGDL